MCLVADQLNDSEHDCIILLLLVLRKREKLGMMHDYYQFSGTITKLRTLKIEVALFCHLCLFLCCLESLTCFYRDH